MAGRGIEIDYTENVAELNPDNLRRYDALILYANIDRIEPREEKALLDYVAGGGGFVPAALRFVLLPQLAALHRAGRRPVPAARDGRVRHENRRRRTTRS